MNQPHSNPDLANSESNIEFPCDKLLMKIIGYSSENFESKVLSAIDALGLQYLDDYYSKISKQGVYTSLSVHIQNIESKSQLDKIYNDLAGLPFVRMVL